MWRAHQYFSPGRRHDEVKTAQFQTLLLVYQVFLGITASSTVMDLKSCPTWSSPVWIPTIITST